MPNMQDQETMTYFGHSGLVLDPRRDRKRIEEENRAMQEIRQRRMQQQEFGTQQAARQQAHEDTLAAQKVAQEQLGTYREGMAQNREAALEERRSADIDKLLQNPQALDAAYGKGAGAAITKAMLDKRMQSSGVGPISIPADAGKVALAQASGGRIPIPQPTVIGGGAPTTQPTTVAGPGPQSQMPGQAEAAHYDPTQQANVANGQVVGAPDPSVGALRGSVVTPDLGRAGGVNIRTPSGGFIGATSRFAPSELASRIGGTSPTNPAPTEQAATGAQPVNFSPSGLAGPHPNAAGVPSATTTHIAGPNVQPQRELVPADYIGHFLGQAAGAVGGAVNPLGRGMQASMAPNPPPFMSPTKKPTPQELLANQQ